jgi:peptidoglycan/xylan/chitin deacetylase (PgdA/CDA1 family)
MRHKEMAQIILNFHGIGPVSRKMDSGEFECWLEQDRFYAILDIIEGQSNVRLTFDDGNASDFEIALPALLQRGLRATFFVCSGRLDQATFLKRSQIREIQSHGMQIGSHGIAHCSWRHLDQAQLREEIEDSQRSLEAVCGSPVGAAACPFGAYDRHVLNELRQADYRFVYTSDGGSAEEKQWLQARNTITRSMQLVDVQRLILRGVGAGAQLLINFRKLLKRIRS